MRACNRIPRSDWNWHVKPEDKLRMRTTATFYHIDAMFGLMVTYWMPSGGEHKPGWSKEGAPKNLIRRFHKKRTGISIELSVDDVPKIIADTTLLAKLWEVTTLEAAVLVQMVDANNRDAIDKALRDECAVYEVDWTRFLLNPTNRERAGKIVTLENLSGDLEQTNAVIRKLLERPTRRR